MLRYVSIITMISSIVLCVSLIIEGVLKYFQLYNPIVSNQITISIIGELFIKSLLIILVFAFQFKYYKQQNNLISSLIFILSIIIYSTKGYYFLQ